jgi:hypothetical protein
MLNKIKRNKGRSMILAKDFKSSMALKKKTK